MIPSKEELLPYVHNRKEAAAKFSVTEKTIMRWLQKYGLYQPRSNYGPGKLSLEIARQIRRSYNDGKTMTELATEHGVTVSTISRVLHNIIHKEKKDFAIVSAVYNLTS